MQVFSDSLTGIGLGSTSTVDPIELRLEAMQDQIAALEAELSRSDRLATLGAMSGAVAHEFNNILTPLINYASMALANLDDDRLVRKALQKTLENAERATQIAESLLGSLQSPGAASDHCNLHSAVERALGTLIRSPEADGIEVLIDIAGDLEAAIHPADLHQVLLNLILNACDAMRPGPGTLAITAGFDRQSTSSGECSIYPNNFLSATGGEFLALRVVDTGCGIEPELIDQVFEPLVTTKEWEIGPKQQGGGSGLGLTICKKLVERAGGHITVRSEPGVGTCFSMRLPGVREAEVERRINQIAA